MTALPVLDVLNLSVEYRTNGGALRAVRDVSCAIEPGMALGVVGESGSGKSTLAGAILDLLSPGARVTSGVIRFDGSDLRALGPVERRAMLGRRIGSVFQDPFTSLNPSMRVGEQIAEPMIQHLGLTRREALDRARGLLAELGIGRSTLIAEAYPHQLSGGMKQRALLASALSCEPPLIILDEPTTALDVTIEAQILDLLADLRARRRLSLMLISHNLAVVRRLCDRITVLYAGEVVEDGDVEAIFRAPAHPYTKGLLASLPRLADETMRERLISIPGGLPDLTQSLPGCAFTPRCPFAEPKCRAVDQALADAGPSRRARCWRVSEIATHPWPRSEGRGRDGAIRPPTDVVIHAEGLVKEFRVGSFWDRSRLERAANGRLAWGQPKKTRAVDRVTLTIRQGEILGLVGESGCGKTTLGRCMIRLIQPSSGQVMFDGMDIIAEHPTRLRRFRREAQIIFQNPDSSLNPRMTVGRIIARPLELFSIVEPRAVKARVGELLERVRLAPSFADRYPHQLSGGEKQRVGIARALASEPRFIVCDEAVSALDVSVQAAVVNLLADLRADLGLALLFISHDISVVAHLADRIAVMYQGRICEIGPTRQVLRPPYHPYTQALLSAAPQVALETDGHVRVRLAGEVGDAAPTTPRCLFAARCQMRVGEVCVAHEPEWIAVGKDHRIACHHGLPALAAMAPIVGAGPPRIDVEARRQARVEEK